MKVMTILGTRPELIRLSLVIERLDPLCEHVLVHTGQNYEAALGEVFFSELGIRAPDRHLGVRGQHSGERVGQILSSAETVMRELKPDRVLVLGDTDSALAGFMAKRLGIPLFHLEAGNRCFDDRVPEEVNRRVIDHSSDVLMPYSEQSRAHLLREGIAPGRIYVTGNPIAEVLRRHREAIAESDVLSRLGLKASEYFLLTAHRQENIDLEPRLRSLIAATRAVARRHGMPVICSVHPRLRARLEQFGVEMTDADVRPYPAFGFFDFVQLERNARCVLTDSGTVQEECCILGIPAVTLRDTTERPETIECGSNVLSGVEPEAVLRAVTIALAGPGAWVVPPAYLAPRVSDTVVAIVLGANQGRG
ncbi:MAG: UDP-N-acetylglucosamine 2-epimerase (non-hydrolyzing) [Acidobacteriota bacterium]